MKVIGVIPARLNSSRVPKKALLDICGIPMVCHVLLRAKMCQELESIYVATDNEDTQLLIKEAFVANNACD